MLNLNDPDARKVITRLLEHRDAILAEEEREQARDGIERRVYTFERGMAAGRRLTVEQE